MRYRVLDLATIHVRRGFGPWCRETVITVRTANPALCVRGHCSQYHLPTYYPDGTRAFELDHGAERAREKYVRHTQARANWHKPRKFPRAKVLTGLLVLVAACTPAQGWAWSAVAVDSLIVCDNQQTVYVSDHGRWDRHTPDGAQEVELNPLLGHTPSEATLYLAAGGATHLVAAVATSAKVPAWAKIATLAITAAAETAVIVGNARYAPGLCGHT